MFLAHNSDTLMQFVAITKRKLLKNNWNVGTVAVSWCAIPTGGARKLSVGPPQREYQSSSCKGQSLPRTPKQGFFAVINWASRLWVIGKTYLRLRVSVPQDSNWAQSPILPFLDPTHITNWVAAIAAWFKTITKPSVIIVLLVLNTSAACTQSLILWFCTDFAMLKLFFCCRHL